jgi:predicted transcriptional regulator
LFAATRSTDDDGCAQNAGELARKGWLRRRKEGREFIYLARQSKKRAGAKALKEVLKTYFDGSIGHALATHLSSPGSLSDSDVLKLNELIDGLNTE